MDTSSYDPIAAEDKIPTENYLPEPEEQEPNLNQWRVVLDLILDFFSSSSNEVLLFAFVALIGATYIVLGRFGLLLIGIASGIALHASWEGMNTGGVGDPSEERNSKRRRELALDIVNQMLDWPQRKPTAIGSNNDTPQQPPLEDYSMLEFESIGALPETAAALQSLTDAVLRDYVNYWYRPILPSDTKFPTSCRRVLTGFITSVSLHLSRKRTADAFLEFLTNSSSMAIVFLNELSTAFQVVGSPMPPEQTVRRYLELYPESSLANVLVGTQQQKKLNMIADDILLSFLDSKAYACLPVRDFLREVLAGVVLESIVSSLSRPEFINGWIIHLFNEGESEIMNAIDAGVESARTQGIATAKDSSSVNTANSAPTNMEDAESSPSHFVQKLPESTDKATEDAMLEAKRLSAMIAASSTTRPTTSTTDVVGKDSNPDNQNENASDEVESLSTHGTIDPNFVSDTRSGNMANPFTPAVSSPSTAGLQESHLQGPISDQASSSTVSTLYYASISVDDASEQGGNGLLRSKPTSDYMIQVEPASTRCTGWMVFRKYADFESLHEALETISRLNKIAEFTEKHPGLPSWKGHIRDELTRNLQRYLHDALRYEPLAESARMRRFLEKDGGVGEAASTVKSGFSFPTQIAFENMGKGVLDVLSNAPKGVSDGGKAVFDGVTGVFGSGIGKKQPTSFGFHDNVKLKGGQPELSASTANRFEGNGALRGDMTSLEPETPKLHDLQSLSTLGDGPSPPDSASLIENGEGSSQTNLSDSAFAATCNVDLPKPHLSDEAAQNGSHAYDEKATPSQSEAMGSKSPPITQEETRIAVELIFAVINELYTLSSAWNIRRTLLNAAKSYILRPGNPNLETIRGLLQESMIDANTSDKTIASYIAKLRENALPTEDELASWPLPPDGEEKTRLRDTARRALTQGGLPQALTSVMGAAASREALEKVFDCLQVEPIARGFVFSVLLQALRAMIL